MNALAETNGRGGKKSRKMISVDTCSSIPYSLEYSKQNPPMKKWKGWYACSLGT